MYNCRQGPGLKHKASKSQRIWQIHYTKIRAQVEKNVALPNWKGTSGLMHPKILNPQVPLNPLSIQKWPNLPSLGLLPSPNC